MERDAIGERACIATDIFAGPIGQAERLTFFKARNPKMTTNDPDYNSLAENTLQHIKDNSALWPSFDRLYNLMGGFQVGRPSRELNFLYEHRGRVIPKTDEAWSEAVFEQMHWDRWDTSHPAQMTSVREMLTLFLMWLAPEQAQNEELTIFFGVHISRWATEWIKEDQPEIVLPEFVAPILHEIEKKLIEYLSEWNEELIEDEAAAEDEDEDE
jgi:hypothetical protein